VTDEEKTHKLMTDLIAALAAQQATQQGSQQAAQTTGQQQSAQGVRSATQESVVGTEIAETMGGERSQLDNQADSAAWRANSKRTYDEYQNVSLDGVRDNRKYVEKVLSDAQNHTDTRNNIATQALQNAVETANLVGKGAVDHRDLAHDRAWNVDEQGYTARAILSDEVFKDGLKAAVVEAVTAALATKK